MAEFFEVVALARFRLALQIRKQLAACVAAGVAPKLFADKPLQRANRDGLVDAAPAARRLAGSAANASAERSQRIGPTRYQISAFVVPGSNGPYVPAGISMDWAGILALDLLAPVLAVRYPDVVTRLVHTLRLLLTALLTTERMRLESSRL